MNKYISENYLNEFHFTKAEKNSAKRIGLITGAIAVSVGVFRGLWGAANGYMKVDSHVEERIAHWESKLIAARNDKEKKEAEIKLTYWNSIKKSKRWKDIKRLTVKEFKKGVLTGSLAGFTLASGMEYKNGSFDRLYRKIVM